MSAPDFMQFHGVEILVFDLSEATLTDLQERIVVAKRLIESRPPGTVRTLTIAFGAPVTPESVAVLEAYVAHNRPYVCRAAVYGADGPRADVVEQVQRSSGRAIRTFGNLNDALDWLAAPLHDPRPHPPTDGDPDRQEFGHPV